jgi:hypoxanthine phosphoribosyltransferase
MTNDKIKITWKNITKQVNSILKEIRQYKIDTVVGIKRGGSIPATLISYKRDFNRIEHFDCHQREWNDPTVDFEPLTDIVNKSEGGILIVDDICDTGVTLLSIHNHIQSLNLDKNVYYAVCIIRKELDIPLPIISGEAISTFSWIDFPWD